MGLSMGKQACYVHFLANGRRYQTCLGSSTTTFGYILTTHPVHNSAQTRVILNSREVFVGRQLAINKTPKQVQIFIYPVIWKILGLLSSPSGKSPSRLRQTTSFNKGFLAVNLPGKVGAMSGTFWDICFFS